MIAQVSVGTPLKHMNVLLSLASFSTWLADETCESCAKITRYNGAKSKTFEDLKTPFDQELYGKHVKGTWTQGRYILYWICVPTL